MTAQVLRRHWLGIANVGDMLSNLPFAIVGVLGLWWLRSAAPTQLEPALKTHWRLFFLGVAAASLGSAYYHLAPSNISLMWDRLPLSASTSATGDCGGAPLA